MIDKIRKFVSGQRATSDDSIPKAAPEEPWPEPPKRVSMVFVDAVIRISPDASIQDFFDTFEADLDRKFAVDKTQAHINSNDSGELYLRAEFWGFPDASYADLELHFIGSSDYKLINAMFEFRNRTLISSIAEEAKYSRFLRGMEALDALKEQQACKEVAV